MKRERRQAMNIEEFHDCALKFVMDGFDREFKGRFDDEALFDEVRSAVKDAFVSGVTASAMSMKIILGTRGNAAHGETGLIPKRDDDKLATLLAIMKSELKN